MPSIFPAKLSKTTKKDTYVHSVHSPGAKVGKGNLRDERVETSTGFHQRGKSVEFNLVGNVLNPDFASRRGCEYWHDALR